MAEPLAVHFLFSFLQLGLQLNSSISEFLLSTTGLLALMMNVSCHANFVLRSLISPIDEYDHSGPLANSHNSKRFFFISLLGSHILLSILTNGRPKRCTSSARPK
jgi:hypothetical protein